MSIHQDWLGKISRAEAVQETRKKDWETALDLDNCEYFSKVYGGQDPERVDVHFINWYIGMLVALTYFRDPFIFVKPKHSNFDGFAETMETALNYHWRELKLKQEFKRTIKSGFLMPPGWMKLGYTAKVGEDVAKIDEVREKSLIKNLKNMIMGKDSKESRPEDSGILNVNIKEESVFATWIPSWNILMPEGYQLVDKMPYLIEIEDVPFIDFSSNRLYKEKDMAVPTRNVNESTKGKVLDKVSFTKETSIYQKDEEACVRLYHIWDRRGNQRLTVSSKAIHFEGKWPYDMEGFPYKPLIFDETLPSFEKSNPYPVNAITPILPQILEQSSSRTMMAKHRKRAAAYIIAQKGGLTEEEIDQISENEIMQIVFLSNMNAIQSGVLPQISPDVYKVDEVILRDLQMATNMGQMMFQPMAGTRTATQAQMAQSGMQLKASARVDVVEDYTVDIARNMAQLLWQFYTREQISEIIGEPITANMWPDLPEDRNERRRVIQKEFMFNIDAGSTAPPKDETVDRKQFLDAVSIAASIAPERLKKDETLRQIFKRFKYIKDLDKIVISNDDAETKAAEEENNFLSQNVPQVVGPNENHILHVQVHSQIQKPSDASDIHISEHGKFLGITGDTGEPQEGDTRPPMKSTKPESVREAPPKQGDIFQSTQNLGAGSKGGM